MSDYVNELMSQQFEMEFQVQVPFLQLARALILDRLLNSLSLSITVYKTGTQNGHDTFTACFTGQWFPNSAVSCNQSWTFKTSRLPSPEDRAFVYSLPMWF